MSTAYALYDSSICIGIDDDVVQLGELDPESEKLYFRSLAASGNCLELIADRLEMLAHADTAAERESESRELVRLLRFLQRQYSLTKAE